MVQGRRPNVERRRQAADLRGQGLSLKDIGRHMGITYQAVQRMLRDMRHDTTQAVHCCACGAEILTTRTSHEEEELPALCLPCLARRPRVSFDQRLRAFRLAAGLTQGALSRLAGLAGGTVQLYEEGGHEPRWGNLAKLIRILGPGLAALGFPEGETGLLQRQSI